MKRAWTRTGATLKASRSVWIERGEARVEGVEELRPMGLRVSQIYRREADGWKIIHRHGDAITDKIAPEAV